MLYKQNTMKDSLFNAYSVQRTAISPAVTLTFEA